MPMPSMHSNTRQQSPTAVIMSLTMAVVASHPRRLTPSLSSSTSVSSSRLPRRAPRGVGLTAAASLVVGLILLGGTSAQSSSKPPTPSPTPAPAPAPAPTTGELINGFAACMSSGEVNTPYCPHNPKNVESPIAGARYPLGSRLLMTWNSNWSTFAANSNVDLYLCPLDSSDQCRAMALRVPAKSESEERSLDASIFRPGNYFYVVVQSGDSPIVPFTMRGPTFTISPPPATSTTGASTVSVRIPDAASVTQNPGPTATTSPATLPQDAAGLSLSTIAIICGIAAAAVVALLGLVYVARRRRAQANRKQAARASVLGTLPGSGKASEAAATSGGGAESPNGSGASSSSTSGGDTGAAGTAGGAYNMLRRAGSMTKPPRVGPTPAATGGGDTGSGGGSGGESPALLAASAPMTPVPASAPLTAAASPGRLAATPVAGAISSTEAILIANSFKLALKKSIEDDDDEDISTMINSLGMRPIPDGGGAGGAGVMSPTTPAAAVLLDTPVPPTMTSPPGLVPRSLGAPLVPTPAAPDVESLKSASPVAPGPASLVVHGAGGHSTLPHISSPLALGATGRQLSLDDHHSLLSNSMPRSLDDSTSLPRSISETGTAGHMTVERVSLDHRDRESTLLGRTPVKHVGSPYTAVVVVDPEAAQHHADEEMTSTSAAAPAPPTGLVSLPRSESGSMPRVSIVPELDEGSSGDEDSSARSLVVDMTAAQR